MIVWAFAGLLVGWFLARRLRVDSLGVVLATSIVVPLVVFVVVHRFVPDVLWGYGAFWAAVQSAYLAVNLLRERPEPADAGSLENA